MSVGHEAAPTPAPPEPPRDARLDRAITWGLTTLTVIAFGWCGKSFSGLQDEVHGMRDEMSKQGTRIAVVEEQRRLEALDFDRRLQAIERWKEQQEGKK